MAKNAPFVLPAGVRIQTDGGKLTLEYEGDIHLQDTLGLDVDERLTFAGAPPTLVIAGDLDGIAPQASVEHLFRRLGSRDKEFAVLGMQTAGVRFGHVDLLIGRHAPAFVWPRLLRFLVDDRPHQRG